MKILSKRLPFLLILALIVSLCPSCSQGPEGPADAAPQYPRQSVELIAPAGVRSGSDLTLRSVAQCLRDTGLVQIPLPVTNRPGDGGGIALSYLAEHAGADDVLAVFSPPICLIQLNGNTSLSYQENTTPIARLITDYGCFAVASGSPYQNLNQVMDALREDPSSLRIGGASSVGSMDHVQFLKVAQAAGIESLDQIQYTGFEDGRVLAQLLGGHVDLVSMGIGDVVGLVESGDVRVLGITAEKRVGSGIAAQMPTCIEQGINATFYNWRGIFGPKDMPEEALEFWENALAELVQTQEWADTCTKYGWDMDYLGRQDFEAFLAAVNEEYAHLLKQVGLLDREQPEDS